MVWDFFDGIYCINLYTRDDRLKKSKKVFNKLNIPVTYYRVEKHPTSGAKGCFESHMSIIKKAYHDGCKNVLIFEDDLIDNSFYDEALVEKAINFMKKSCKWDIFYFGHQPDIFWNTSRKVSDFIIKTHSYLTHAYVVSRRYMKKLLDKEYYGIPIDKMYLKNEHSYALYPMIFYQDESESDIETSSGTINFRYSELYAYNVNYSIISLILIILFILISIFILNKSLKE